MIGTHVFTLRGCIWCKLYLYLVQIRLLCRAIVNSNQNKGNKKRARQQYFIGVVSYLFSDFVRNW